MPGVRHPKSVRKTLTPVDMIVLNGFFTCVLCVQRRKTQFSQASPAVRGMPSEEIEQNTQRRQEACRQKLQETGSVNLNETLGNHPRV